MGPIHPGLTYFPSFLPPSLQQLLLSRSLALLSSPSQTSSASRRLLLDYLRANPHQRNSPTFHPDSVYSFEPRHFDGVIEGYRELLIKEPLIGSAEEGNVELREAVKRFYDLIPPPESMKGPVTDPPSHLILHALHLSSKGAIYPHVDNMQAFGGTIAGLSLGSSRVMRFKRTGPPLPKGSAGEDEPEEFEVLMEPGSVYLQKGRLRTHYAHEVPVEAEWEGKRVGGEQRISLMLRDRLPSNPR